MFTNSKNLNSFDIPINSWLIGDLHIHSRFSRACSKDLNIENLVKWARIKGIGLLGTGDFTHPEWLNELKEKLKEEEGIFYFEDKEVNLEIKAFKSKGKFPFILSSEISLIYTQDNKGRRVHLVYLAPSFEVVDKINKWLDTKGRRDYDGRPIFKISCRDFVKKMIEIDKRIEIIPAHIWTPYFGVFGSMSGFDSLKEAFGDMVENVHSIETGISSDPEMNWKIKDLDNKSIISFSDSHSFWPWRLGREATIFKKNKLSYNEIIRQIRENDFLGTIETDPAYGKYHYDGHAKCKFSCSFSERKKLNNLCKVCGKPLRIGVDSRVEELSGDSDNKHKKHFYKILPLHEIISLGIGIGMNSKGCWNIYNKLIKHFENEFNILLNVSEEELNKVLENKLIIKLILKNRNSEINVKPGYDGEYGVALLDNINKEKEFEKGDIQKINSNKIIQKKLFL